MCEFMCLHMHGSGGRCVARMRRCSRSASMHAVPSYMAMCECICTFIHTRICEHAYFTMHVHACPTVAFGSGGKQTTMEREPASDIITGVCSRRPRIDATSFHKKRKRQKNTEIKEDKKNAPHETVRADGDTDGREKTKATDDCRVEAENHGEASSSSSSHGAYRERLPPLSS